LNPTTSNIDELLDVVVVVVVVDAIVRFLLSDILKLDLKVCVVFAIMLKPEDNIPPDVWLCEDPKLREITKLAFLNNASDHTKNITYGALRRHNAKLKEERERPILERKKALWEEFLVKFWDYS
jgi:hypothetical protein